MTYSSSVRVYKEKIQILTLVKKKESNLTEKGKWWETLLIVEIEEIITNLSWLPISEIANSYKF